MTEKQELWCVQMVIQCFFIEDKCSGVLSGEYGTEGPVDRNR